MEDFVKAKAEAWLNGNYDEQTKSEVRRMLNAEDKTELVESFYKDLEFGTGGLRGIMGVGSNRMNIYTVGAATQGLSNYLNREFKGRQISVVVGHDCRNNSRLFAETVANIFSANGIKVYLFEDLRPTPEISFAIRHLKCQSGVIITASHNPKIYNGYKAYWEDGAQIIAPHDVNIISEVGRIKSPDEIKFQPNKELIEIIGENVDAEYLAQVKTVLLSPESIKRHHDIKIVYTPIHGTGITLVPRCLREIGFTNVHVVEEQAVVSGDFPTVVSPNPEEPAALDLAIKKAKDIDADIVLASDPDADRMGMAVKDDKGEWTLVTGNQTAMMFTYYILKRRSELGLLSSKDFMVKTIVTTEMIKKICDDFKTELVDCYTGFKWIAGEVREREGKQHYIGGGEESYGYMPADFVRDKDSVSCCSLMSELAAWALDNGMSVYQFLLSLYQKYGFSLEKGISIVREGKSGAEQIVNMMKNYRSNPPMSLAGSKVMYIRDFQLLQELNVLTGAKFPIPFSTTSNVLQYITEDGTKVSVRPSGTEPKIKFYVEVQSQMKDASEYKSCINTATGKVDQIKKDLNID
ncbi:MAG: phospho-sugar mutase [Paludibacteraceae bacterium]|nr:phospho-sugar mutase [Paludibacteraceae bacterium]